MRENERMETEQEGQELLQYRLRTLFIAVFVIASVLGVWRFLGPAFDSLFWFTAFAAYAGAACWLMWANPDAESSPRRNA